MRHSFPVKSGCLFVKFGFQNRISSDCLSSKSLIYLLIICHYTGLTDPIWDVEPSKDGKPYTTLIYSNGPGWVEPRANLTDVDTRM